jgi:CRISPR system Cascade subunit CasD
MSEPRPPVGAAGHDRAGPVYSLVLRLAGPLQSWGGQSQFNRRDTMGEPTKSGIIGLLAAAQGRRRQDPIEDLLDLKLGVRTDQPGSLLRDYHTASDHRDRPLLSAQVNAKGAQKPTSPAKLTHVTHRFYLQDAAFVAAVSGPEHLLNGLVAALRQPAFPLALGRRACPPTQPLIITPRQGEGADTDAVLWPGSPGQVLTQVPWQASETGRAALRRDAARRKQAAPASINLPITVDAEANDDRHDVRADVPRSFDHRERGFTTRWVRQDWANNIDTGFGPGEGNQPAPHDPFALLGW